MAFETYYPRLEKKKSNKVAISKHHITLTPDLVEKINSDSGVELAYDAETKTIRIRPSNEGKGLGINNKNKIGAKGFFEHFGLQIKGKFEARYEEDEKAIYVQVG